MALASTSSRNLLSTGIDTNKEAQCTYYKVTGHFHKKLFEIEEETKMEDKNGKKPQRQTYPPCETCGKKIIQRKDVGKALEPIYVPRGPDMMKKPTKTQMTKENPRSRITNETSPLGQSSHYDAKQRFLYFKHST